jgi:hypothetical protein
MSKQKNRGKEASDDANFGNPKQQQKISDAILDLSHLLSRGYAEKSSLLLVGNRYRLNTRQQRAVQGMSASVEQIEYRNKCTLSIADLEEQEVMIDGFNIIIILESILSDAYVFEGVDAYFRDLSSVHGTYKKVQQTTRAIELITCFYTKAKLSKMHWVFDKPVSNSGRLKQMIEDIALENNYNWEVSLAFNPDKMIAESNQIAITSDAWILDNVQKSFNLVSYFVENKFVPNHSIISK